MKRLLITDLENVQVDGNTEILNIDDFKRKPGIIFKLCKKYYNKIQLHISRLDFFLYAEIWKTILLILRSKDRIITDKKNNEIKVTFLNYLLRDLPHLVGEICLSPFLLLKVKFRIKSLLSKCYIRKNNGTVNNILYLRTDPWPIPQAGGSISHTYGVAKGFVNLGKKVFFVTSDNITIIEKLKCPTFVFPPFKRIRNIKEISEMIYSEDLFQKILCIFKDKKPDIIYQRYSRNNFTGVLFSLKYDIPFILEYNGSEVWIAKNWGKRLIFENIAKEIEILNLKFADLIVVVSEALKEELLRIGIDAEKILVNPNGFDPELYNSSVDGSEIRKKYNLENKIVVGFVGTFGPWHGVEILAKAVKKVLQKKPDIRFLLVGGGVNMREVRKILKEDGVEDFVVFTGIVPSDKVPEFLAVCDILVSPHVPNPDGSRFFGSPTKLFEYMGMRKAIVASNLEQIGKILENEKDALLVEPGNVDELARGIIRLAEDELLRKTLGKNAWEKALRNYTWEKNVERTLLKWMQINEKRG